MGKNCLIMLFKPYGQPFGKILAPTPEDFFVTMEDGFCVDLDWSGGMVL